MNELKNCPSKVAKPFEKLMILRDCQAKGPSEKAAIRVALQRFTASILLPLIEALSAKYRLNLAVDGRNPQAYVDQLKGNEEKAIAKFMLSDYVDVIEMILQNNPPKAEVEGFRNDLALAKRYLALIP